MYQTSCLTINVKTSLTFHPASPIVSANINSQFVDAFSKLLERFSVPKSTEDKIGGVKELSTIVKRLTKGTLPLATAIAGLAYNLPHLGAWSTFLTDVTTIRDNLLALFLPPVD